MVTKSTAKTDAAGRRVKTKGEAPMANYKDKGVTPVVNLFADWLEENLDEKLNERDRQVLMYGSALRGTFQKSDVNQERMAARALEVEAEEEAREARRAAREQAKLDAEEHRAARAKEREEAKAAKAAEPKKPATKTAAAKPATKSAPAKPAARKTAATAAAKPATTRRRPAAKKDTDGDF